MNVIPYLSEEIIQIGRIGLWEASKRFDPSRGIAFATFATKRIKGSILDYKIHESGVKYASYRTIKKMLNFVASNYDGVSIHDIDWEKHAVNIGVTPRMCSNALSRSKIEYCLSTDDEVLRKNIKARTNKQYEDMEQLDFILKQSRLKENEKRVIISSLIDETTLLDIGEEMELSESRVCQIRRSAMEKLKSYYQKQLTKDRAFRNMPKT